MSSSTGLLGIGSKETPFFYLLVLDQMCLRKCFDGADVAAHFLVSQEHSAKAACAQNGPLLKVIDGAAIICILCRAADRSAHNYVDLQL